MATEESQSRQPSVVSIDRGSAGSITLFVVCEVVSVQQVSKRAV